MNTSSISVEMIMEQIGDDFFIVGTSGSFQPLGKTFVNRNLVILLVRQGNVKCHVNSKDYLVRPFNILIIPPGQSLRVDNVEGTFAMEGVSMSRHFTEGVDFGKELQFLGCGFRPFRIIHCDAAELFRGYFELCTTIISLNHSAEALPELSLVTTAFFYKLGTFVSERGAYYGGFPELTSSFLRLVEENYRKHRDLVWYADKLCKSPKYLSRQIKSESGKNASNWIDDRICDEAKSFLSSSQMTISELSDYLGFPSQSYFGRFFKRIIGLSPMQYRKRYSEFDVG